MVFGCCGACKPQRSLDDATVTTDAELVETLPVPGQDVMPALAESNNAEITETENIPVVGMDAIPTLEEFKEVEAPEKDCEPVHEDPSSCRESAVPFDCAEEVREALVQKLLRPLVTSNKGWPLSEIALNIMKMKQALADSSVESTKSISSWLFGVTKRPDTHRMLAIDIHDNVLDLSVERLSLTNEKLVGLAEAWRSSRRQEALDKGFVFGPGSEFQRWMMGNSRGLPEKPADTTDVHVHMMGIGNPHWFDSIFSFYGHIFATAHLAKSPEVGSTITKTLKDLLPETHRVQDDMLVSEETQYVIVEEANVHGVLRHTFKTRWNLEGIERRFGKDPRDLFRNRPMYTLTVEDIAEVSPGSKRVALKVVESHGHLVEIFFFTAQCGSLVWMTSDGKPIIQNRQPALVPGRRESQIFHVRVFNAKLPLTGCGCFLSAVDLPQMIFSFDIRQDPYPILSLRCLEMGAFPLEWFWAPLFSGMQMRFLLMRFFTFQLHFKEDEIHTHIEFQIPRLSSVLKRALHAVSNTIIGVIFSPPDKDPVPVFLQAFGRDCAALERGE